MKELPQVILVCVDCFRHEAALAAIQKSLEQIKPHSVLFCTDMQGMVLARQTSIHPDVLRLIQIDPITSTEEYSEFVMKDLWRHLAETPVSHVLLVQHDGYVLNGEQWTDEFLMYDYIGAPWLHPAGPNVGNGGFSLRSKRLMSKLAFDPQIQYTHPEDEMIGRLYRTYLEDEYDIKIAPEHVAHRFSFELHMPLQPTFGFHGKFWEPFRPRVVIKRSASMGDVIMAEPLMEYFHKQGYWVFLDILPEYWSLFDRHHFRVDHASLLTTPPQKYVDLDMAYENKPEQLALLSYFEAAEVPEPEKWLRNARLNFPVKEESKLFSKYVVLHIDDTAMAHRNIHDVDWVWVVSWLQDHGYLVIQIGNGLKRYGTYMNCTTKSMMMYVIAGADLMLAIDSGPAQAAVALGVKSVIVFGSVNPKYRYHDFSNITVVQNSCPIGKDGCYHKVQTEVGQDCEVDVNQPPCMIHSAERLISILEHELQILKQ